MLKGKYCWLKSGRLNDNFSLLGADDAGSCPVESDTQVDRDVNGFHFVIRAITRLPLCCSSDMMIA